MTVYIWDGSSYDGHISVDQFRRAMAEGVVAFTHRLTRQFGALDTYAATNLANARTAGITLLGAYAVSYTAGGDQQDELTVRYADQQVPWWRTFPGWFWQVDLERWSNDTVPAAVGIAEAQQLRASTDRQAVLYASHSQYGDQLHPWDGPLWNADYCSRPPGTVAAMYPGDTWAPLHGSGTSAWRGGWTPYSGQAPALLQYTSSATIGGLTTCDASAYRGTLAQLTTLLTGGTDVPQPTTSEVVRLLAQGSDDRGFVPATGTPDVGAESVDPAAHYNLKAIMAKLDGLKVPPIDQAALNAAVAAALSDPTVLAAVATAVNDDAARRLTS